MPGKTMAAAVATELQRQVNQELGAAHAYLAMATWCEYENMKGFARFFRKQAAEERGHADRLLAHLIDRKTMPELVAVPAPKTQFDAVLEVARLAQKMERGNTMGIHACYDAAVKAGDYAAQVLLQWFINEQVEEEAWSDEMVERVEASACAGATAELDRHIERYLEDHPSKPEEK